jgi:hypothetical protein
MFRMAGRMMVTTGADGVDDFWSVFKTSSRLLNSIFYSRSLTQDSQGSTAAAPCCA